MIYIVEPVTINENTRGIFVVAHFTQGERDEMDEAVVVVSWVVIIVLSVASVLAWVVAGRVLAPLRLLSDASRSITESDLTQRIPVQGANEIAELTTTFNEMLDRLQAAFTSQRNFIDDASYELQTPITIIQGHLSANSYGVEISLQISSGLTLGSWVGFTQATAQDLEDAPEASIFNYAVTFIFPDLGKEGNVAGIVFGQPPKLIDNGYSVNGENYEDEGTSLHLEAFYLFQATDNILITPGLLVIVNPEHDNNNDTVYVGTLRTTISF